MSIAAPNDENSNPLPMIAEVRLNILALITIVNSPIVRRVIGNDKINKIGLTAKFNTDKTKLAPKATHILST